ncbi:ethylene-responsive transcription factor ERF008-like [Gastrolobium bilobum]|uniref:ethylene-responsive transcription factor ERF008-like n=1 Tax=Gastrolobium bilobum TaxID=150636 RepID=UPI002AB1B4B0|nr:ethylene-responsive transcription factor ERF008-like [Gastrolobium bilobum]
MDGDGDGEGGTTRKRGREGETTRYRGIRMRKGGKWVAEIREPRKTSRIWLGSYSTPIAAARAFDTASFYFGKPLDRLNFPQLLVGEGGPAGCDMSEASIRKIARDVGAGEDALQAILHRQHPHVSAAAAAGEFAERVDLSKITEPEISDCVKDRD